MDIRHSAESAPILSPELEQRLATVRFAEATEPIVRQTLARGIELAIDLNRLGSGESGWGGNLGKSADYKNGSLDELAHSLTYMMIIPDLATAGAERHWRSIIEKEANKRLA